MTFWRTVAAYLTGWLIAQPTYQALFRWWRKRELDNPSEETRTYFATLAKAIADELERRADAYDWPALIDAVDHRVEAHRRARGELAPTPLQELFRKERP